MHTKADELSSTVYPRINVLHYATWEEKCGIADYTASLVNALEREGVRATVHPVNRQTLKYMTDDEIRQGIECVCARADKFDLIHVQHEMSFFFNGHSLLSRSLSNFSHLLHRLRSLRKPVVVTFHTEPSFLRPLRVLSRNRQAHGVLHGCLAAAAAALLRTQWRWGVAAHFRSARRTFQCLVHTYTTRLAFLESGFSPENVQVLPMGFAPERPPASPLDRAKARLALGIPQDAILLSIFGFVAAYKGHEVALQALAKLPSRFQLAVVGGSHPENRYDQSLDTILHVARTKKVLRDRVRVTGFVDQHTVDLYRTATDICLAPFHEVNQSGSASIGLALSSGKPVIAGRTATITEISEEADCLLTCAPGATNELAWQIERLVADPRLQETLVSNATKFIEQHSWSTVARRTRALYQRVLYGSSVPVAHAIDSPGRATCPAAADETARDTTQAVDDSESPPSVPSCEDDHRFSSIKNGFERWARRARHL